MREIGEKQPHLVFLDIEMPGKNGLELTEEIRKLNSEITIIFVTISVRRTTLPAGISGVYLAAFLSVMLIENVKNQTYYYMNNVKNQTYLLKSMLKQIV